ncbi:MAG: hypothetical protein K0Q94_2889, partial [Paenibacillus sp.]|nr:hypothetical protein [Paenibacillus sp.]
MIGIGLDPVIDDPVPVLNGKMPAALGSLPVFERGQPFLSREEAAQVMDAA